MNDILNFLHYLKHCWGLNILRFTVTFSLNIPEHIVQMEGKLRLCQMLDKARLKGETFYVTEENHRCNGGSISTGVKERDERSKTGEFLFKELGLFGSKRAARRYINSNPRIEFETVKVIVFFYIR